MVKSFTLSALALLAAAACAPRPYVKGPGNPDVGVTVVWFGHSCFSFRDSAHRRILVDPFDKTVGYRLPWDDSDATFVTHEHFDHNYLRYPGTKEVLRSTGTHTVAGLPVTGVLAAHDPEGGRKFGTTRAYVWSMGGLRFAHLGDIGQDQLSPDQLAAFAGVEVLFVPVGGKTTVDAAAAKRLVDLIQPKIVVPMHYGNPWVRFFEFDPVDPFVALFSEVLEIPDHEFRLRRADLPAVTTLYVPALPAENE